MTAGSPLDPGALYRVLAESTEDAIVTIDDRSVILSVNPSAERLFGYGADELIGGPLARVMPERFRAGHAAGIARYLATGTRHISWRGVEVPIVTRDGREIPVQISFGEFESGGVRIFSAIIRDISVRVAQDAALAASTEQLQGQAIELEQQIEEAHTASEELEQANAQLVSANAELQTARQVAEQSGARVREILDSLADAVCVVDQQWRVTYLNPAGRLALRSVDREPRQVVDAVLWDALPELAGTQFEAAVRRAAATGVPATVEDELPESGRWLETRIAPSATGVTTFTREVTERRHAADLVALREAEYRAFANSIPALAWTARADGFIDWYNDRWYEYTGMTPADMEGWGWQQVHRPDALPVVMEEWARSIETGEPFEMTFPIRGADGRFRRFLTRVAPVKDESGRVTRWFGSNADVEAERAAREAAVDAMRRTERLQALTASLAAVEREEDAMSVVVTETAGATEAAISALYTRIPGTDEATMVREVGIHREVSRQYERFPLSAPGPTAHCLRSGVAIFIGSRDGIIAAYPEVDWMVRRMDIHAVVSIPLVVGGEAIGAMSLAFHEPRPFTPADREFFLAVGRQAAQALDRARLRAESRRLLDALTRERSRLSLVFQEAPVAVAVLRGRVAEELVFEMANPRYLTLVPPEPSPVGMRVFDALPDAGAPLLEVLRRVLTTGETVVVQELRVGVDRDGDGVGEDYFFTATYQPLAADGEIDAIVAVITEVTENVRARHEAERLRAEAEAANRAKGEFLAVMSHELRTPLNAIGGYVELIELGIRGPVSEEQLLDLGRIQQSQRHLLGLINEVLNYAKLETGSVIFDASAVLVRDALASAEALVLPQARLKGLVMTIGECPPGLAVTADPEKLRQVLVNLLSNAVKFTDAGGSIVLAARAAGSVATITVSDTGIGIATDQLERIFEPFVQVRSDLTRTAEGTGLGLAISRDLARGMGGDLTVESTPGEGSRFSISLPLEAVGPS